MTPTGRRRYRIAHRWGRTDLVVLQIEWSVIYVENLCGMIEAETRNVWHDARAEDVTEISA